MPVRFAAGTASAFMPVTTLAVSVAAIAWASGLMAIRASSRAADTLRIGIISVSIRSDVWPQELRAVIGVTSRRRRDIAPALWRMLGVSGVSSWRDPAG